MKIALALIVVLIIVALVAWARSKRESKTYTGRNSGDAYSTRPRTPRDIDQVK